MTPMLRRGLFAAAVTLTAAASQAAPYGANLITNPGAEDGFAGWTAYADTAPFDAVDYGPNWVTADQPGPVDRGARLFVGGSGNAYAAGYQRLDLAAQAGDIGAGRVGYVLSGWLGGWTNQGDNPLVYLSFQDAAGTEVGSALLGPITPAIRNNTTGLFLYETSGALPDATRQVMVTLSMERLSGGDNDGYADNLSFQLTSAVPEPQTWALMGLGLLAVGAVAGRRRA